MKAVGKVIEVSEVSGTSKSGNAWKKKTFVIEFEENGSTHNLVFDLFGEKRIEENPFRKGQVVEVNFSIESKAWNGRWFTSCNAWTVQKADKGATAGIEDTLSNVSLSSASMSALDDTSALPF